jgi:hypothetical protein
MLRSRNSIPMAGKAATRFLRPFVVVTVASTAPSLMFSP